MVAILAIAVLGLTGITLASLRSAHAKQGVLENLYNYEAPIFVWDREVLRSGEMSSAVINQARIKLADGHIESDKAVQIRRGDWADGRFTDSPHGAWFMLTLFKDGQVKGTAVGQLLQQGYGAAETCKPPKPPPKPSPLPPIVSETFDCYFIVTLQPDDGVEVRWTMFHGADSGSISHEMSETPDSHMGH